ncbi:cyclic nucleotide-binding domain-containing protein [Cystoisospora suis]|uniref:Cyclic nucleotide-binding domain-containing protein n=1 Tax=Cystoisospora suis TaxID=483139 RepID=A0A2C6KNJ1_9APIC|nr:cyclic nucleotide-binding domain-containing protein [Cystoisospora suis]
MSMTRSPSAMGRLSSPYTTGERTGGAPRTGEGETSPPGVSKLHLASIAALRSLPGSAGYSRPSPTTAAAQRRARHAQQQQLEKLIQEHAELREQEYQKQKELLQSQSEGVQNPNTNDGRTGVSPGLGGSQPGASSDQGGTKPCGSGWSRGQTFQQEGRSLPNNDTGQPGSSAGLTLRDPAAAEAVAAATAGINAALAAGFMNKPESFHTRCLRVPSVDSSSCAMCDGRGNCNKSCSGGKHGDCVHSAGTKGGVGTPLRDSVLGFSTADKGSRREKQGDSEPSSNKPVPRLDTQQLFSRLSAPPSRGFKAEDNPGWVFDAGNRPQRHANERATSALSGSISASPDRVGSVKQRRGLMSAVEGRGTLRDGNSLRTFSPTSGSGDRGVSLRGVAAASHELASRADPQRGDTDSSGLDWDLSLQLPRNASPTATRQMVRQLFGKRIQQQFQRKQAENSQLIQKRPATRGDANPM